jgi:hypothetical protein
MLWTGAITTIALELITIQVNCYAVPLVGSIITEAICNPSFWATIAIAIFYFANRAPAAAITGAVATVTLKLLAVEINRYAGRTAVPIICRNVCTIIAIAIACPVGVYRIFEARAHTVSCIACFTFSTTAATWVTGT